METLVILNNLILISTLMIFSACGKQVDISSQQLKSYSELNKSAPEKMNAVLVRGNPDKILYESNSYVVTPQSSHLSLQFIKTIPMGKEINVSFRGQMKSGEVVLEILENR